MNTVIKRLLLAGASLLSLGTAACVESTESYQGARAPSNPQLEAAKMRCYSQTAQAGGYAMQQAQWNQSYYGGGRGGSSMIGMVMNGANALSVGTGLAACLAQVNASQQQYAAQFNGVATLRQICLSKQQEVTRAVFNGQNPSVTQQQASVCLNANIDVFAAVRR